MALINQGGKLLLQNGALASGSGCCCGGPPGPCECCDCEVTVDYAGLTFPADNTYRVICVAPDSYIGFFGGPTTVIAEAKAAVSCATMEDGTQRLLVVVYVKARGVSPSENVAVGDDANNMSSEVFASFEQNREYFFTGCDQCGCPQGQPELLYDNYFAEIDYNAIFDSCGEELEEATRTDPSFSFDCEECNPLP